VPSTATLAAGLRCWLQRRPYASLAALRRPVAHRSAAVAGGRLAAAGGAAPAAASAAGLRHAQLLGQFERE